MIQPSFSAHRHRDEKAASTNRVTVGQNSLTIAAAEAVKPEAVPLAEIVARLERLKAGVMDAHRFDTIETPMT